MDHYRSITVWENGRRLRRLEGFRERFLWYVNVGGRRSGGAEGDLDEEIAEARRELTVALRDVRAIVTAAGVSTRRQWFPPRSSGRYPGRIDILEELFDLEGYEVVRTRLVEMLDDAIRVYRADTPHARRRTYSLFWWLRRGLASLGRGASRMLRAVGVHPGSLGRGAGSVLRTFVAVTLLLAAILTIRDLIG